ncbi:Transcriptional regulatory protein MucR [Sphingomonas antarctica]|uniref:MucR family transcriptional regulator n=1 Tax=Sphingomonas antarctica TaxID=2040274 RepID=UPI0039EA7C75
MTDANEINETLITLTADIVAAHVSNNSVSVNDLATLISNVHGALAGLSGVSHTDAAAAPAEKRQPAVSVRSSIKDDHIVCLYDGKKMKMLKRHLMTDHGVTPAQYREEFGLQATYPMVAPAYAEQRRTLAKAIGLGTKRKRSK